METQAVEIIETEVPLEKAMSLNHSRLISRITWLLSAAYEGQYDILPELEFELSAGRLKPDVAVLPRLSYDWESDIVRYPEPPITAVEILSPTQSLDGLITKIRQGYFASGVKSAWLVLPAIRTINLYLPGKPVVLVNAGTLADPASNIEIKIEDVFR
ncbi:Uma2 family endonuclease [Hymenobacter weizhouensis]|uniref:Uma2 family endonuclease n=1 Tax=Hymenobacter sp. YIM 151500-1 TaxID=2987689 RepID=UPI002226636C|nr:Uma2 family endonuclease [Hymenobacter sp. YIM 151500-1]UYZ63568.1 Uma2 family endonuclease [Hymenobacter sp. YIM 151500-1]